jgi:hypothetical protein
MPRTIALVSLLAVFGCSAQYESGVTRCSADGTCPSGFSCRTDLCFSDRSPVGGMGTGGTGTGGVPGTGGMMMGTGGTSGTCTDPMFPVRCPARAGVDAGCWETGVDCKAVVQCANGDQLACKSSMANCKYPANPCAPANMACPNAEHPVYCPALGNVGPDCWTPDTDCTSVVVCNNEVTACNAGSVVDPATCKCTPKPAGMCTADPANPQPCTPPAGVTTQMCYPPDAICGSITTCAGQTVWCKTAGLIADCGLGQCVPATQCQPANPPTTPCGICLFSKCCTSAKSCLADPTCATCAADTNCNATMGGPLYAPFATCVVTNCSVECQ